MRRKKQFTNYVKFSLQYNKNRTILAKLLIFVDSLCFIGVLSFGRLLLAPIGPMSIYALGPLSNGRTINF